ncbi:MAG: cation diffusion facilitator family transporter [Clostridia bacterium]|nr:cation diffusion facilitator family transporter [Clostridia bacterium]
MTNFLIKTFVRDYENTENAVVRTRYGVLSGIVGICLNIILSVFKMIFGALTKSISIVADGVNNLFDAFSSIISLVGFKISGKPADKEHPFGHGRIEYVSALTLAFFILIMGFELAKTSVEKFRNPEQVIFSWPALIVLVCSIFGKIWLAYFNTSVGKKIDSVAVNAVVTDSIGDIAATTGTLIALIASRFTSLPVDAVVGVLVALVVMYAGIGIIKDTMGPLLGEPPSKEIVDKLEELVMSYDGVVGIHDLVLHSYGNAKVIGSLHAEVPANVDVLMSHNIIDNIESDIKEKLGIEISIHMDPVAVDDELTNKLKEIAVKAVADTAPEITIHDFRIVEGYTHTNLIFDAVLPYKFFMTEEEFKNTVSEKIKETDPTYNTVINIDRSYV